MTLVRPGLIAPSRRSGFSRSESGTRAAGLRPRAAVRGGRADVVDRREVGAEAADAASIRLGVEAPRLRTTSSAAVARTTVGATLPNASRTSTIRPPPSAPRRQNRPSRSPARGARRPCDSAGSTRLVAAAGPRRSTRRRPGPSACSRYGTARYGTARRPRTEPARARRRRRAGPAAYRPPATRWRCCRRWCRDSGWRRRRSRRRRGRAAGTPLAGVSCRCTSENVASAPIDTTSSADRRCRAAPSMPQMLTNC